MRPRLPDPMADMADTIAKIDMRSEKSEEEPTRLVMDEPFNVESSAKMALIYLRGAAKSIANKPIAFDVIWEQCGASVCDQTMTEFFDVDRNGDLLPIPDPLTEFLWWQDRTREVFVLVCEQLQKHGKLTELNRHFSEDQEEERREFQREQKELCEDALSQRRDE